MISALLKKNGHHVELFDTTFMDTSYLYDKITHEDVNVDLGFFKDFKLKAKILSEKKIDVVKEFENKADTFKPDFISFFIGEANYMER